jgi:hypothetical protein
MLNDMNLKKNQFKKKHKKNVVVVMRPRPTNKR